MPFMSTVLAAVSSRRPTEIGSFTVAGGSMKLRLVGVVEQDMVLGTLNRRRGGFDLVERGLVGADDVNHRNSETPIAHAVKETKQRERAKRLRQQAGPDVDQGYLRLIETVEDLHLVIGLFQVDDRGFVRMEALQDADRMLRVSIAAFRSLVS
jgi:hypothetical protein